MFFHPQYNAVNSQMKSISIEDVINIDGNKVTVKASVPYSHEDTEYGEIYSYPIEEEHVHETADGTKYLDNEILVVVKDGITRQQVDELAKKYDSVVVGAITVSGDYQLKLNNMVSNEELIKLIDNIGQESIIDSILKFIRQIQLISGLDSIMAMSGKVISKIILMQKEKVGE